MNNLYIIQNILIISFFSLYFAKSLERRELSDFSSPVIQYINPSEGLPHHWYGSAVYVNENVAIVGASGDSDYSKYGNAYILKNQDGHWKEVGKLTASNPGLDDGFGTAVSIYMGYAFVGAYRDDVKGEDSGCVYYFTEESGWKQHQKIYPDDGAMYDYFGSTLAQYRRHFLVVGAWGADYGDLVSCGAAYFFRYYNDEWVLDKKIYAEYPHSYQWFGISVTMYETRAAIGAWGDNEDGSVAGAVFTYAYDMDAWHQVQKLTIGVEYNHMGYAVSMDEGILAVGLPNSYRTIQGATNNPNAFRTGMVAVYRLLDYNHWEFEQYLVCSQCNNLVAYGSALSVAKENILVGMHGAISLWSYNPSETFGYGWNEEYYTLSTQDTDLDSSYFYGSALSIYKNVIMIGIKTASAVVSKSKGSYTSQESGMVVFITSSNTDAQYDEYAAEVKAIDHNMGLYVTLYILIASGSLILILGPLAFFYYYLTSDEYNNDRNAIITKKVELKPLVKS